MPEGQLLEFSGVTKRFGAVTAVSGLTARVEPGRVTGFLGPNGAGKTTTLRILLGLVRATEGRATIGGATYAEMERPLQTVGAVLEASSFHPGRTGAAHLKVYAQAAGLPSSRVDEVLGLVGLSDAAGRKVGGYSLGMRQRLALAYSLLGDPGVLVLDEPANGLDPEGIRWMRGFLRALAREGRTVLISSHLLAEVQQTADALLIISQGRLVFQGMLDELSDPAEAATVVDSPDRAALAEALRTAGVPFEVLRSGLTVRGVEPAQVGASAAAAGVALSSLTKRGPALEEVFLQLVDGTRVHPSAAAGAAGAGTDGEVAAMGAVGAASADAVRTDTAASAPSTVDAPETPAPEPGPVAEPEPAVVAEPEPEAPAPAGSTAAFAVASTGLIDIVPGAAPPEDADVDVEAIGQVDGELSEPDAEPAPAPAPHAAFAVAPTGVIDIVPPDDEAADAPEDADPDVEAIGEIDEELSGADPDDPSGESDEKTEADREADRFFSAFDHAENRDGDDGEAASVDDASSHHEGGAR